MVQLPGPPEVSPLQPRAAVADTAGVIKAGRGGLAAIAQLAQEDPTAGIRQSIGQMSQFLAEKAADDQRKDDYVYGARSAADFYRKNDELAAEYATSDLSDPDVWAAYTKKLDENRTATLENYKGSGSGLATLENTLQSGQKDYYQRGVTQRETARKAAVDNYDATVVGRETYRTTQNPAGLEDSYGVIEQHYDDMRKSGALPPAEIDRRQRLATATLVGGAISGRINRGDYDGAQELLEQYGSMLTPEQSTSLSGDITRARQAGRRDEYQYELGQRQLAETERHNRATEERPTSPNYVPAGNVTNPDGTQTSVYLETRTGQLYAPNQNGHLSPYVPSIQQQPGQGGGQPGQAGGGYISNPPNLTESQGKAADQLLRAEESKRRAERWMLDNPDYMSTTQAQVDQFLREGAGGTVGAVLGAIGGALLGGAVGSIGGPAGTAGGAVTGGSAGAAGGGYVGKSLDPLLERLFQSDEGKQFAAAWAPFINANLRRDTGAAITREEWAYAFKQFIPMPGDDKATLDIKTKNRQDVVDGMRKSSGPGGVNVPSSGAGAPGGVEPAQPARPQGRGATGSWGPAAYKPDPNDYQDALAAFKQQESGGNVHAVSVQGAAGSLQIMPDTFKQYARPGEHFDSVRDREDVAHRAFAQLYLKYGGDLAKLAVAWFSGPGNVNTGKGRPWKNDVADGNGVHVSDYVMGILHKAAHRPRVTTV